MYPHCPMQAQTRMMRTTADFITDYLVAHRRPFSPLIFVRLRCHYHYTSCTFGFTVSRSVIQNDILYITHGLILLTNQQYCPRLSYYIIVETERRRKTKTKKLFFDEDVLPAERAVLGIESRQSQGQRLAVMRGSDGDCLRDQRRSFLEENCPDSGQSRSFRQSWPKVTILI